MRGGAGVILKCQCTVQFETDSILPIKTVVDLEIECCIGSEHTGRLCDFYYIRQSVAIKKLTESTLFKSRRYSCGFT